MKLFAASTLLAAGNSASHMANGQVSKRRRLGKDHDTGTSAATLRRSIKKEAKPGPGIIGSTYKSESDARNLSNKKQKKIKPLDSDKGSESVDKTDVGILSNEKQSPPLFEKKRKLNDSGIGYERKQQKKADVGVLSNHKPNHNKQFSSISNLQAECPDGQESVVCVDGMADDEFLAQTCAQACDGECCTEARACESFTGTVCKDGVSCGGIYSCFFANVGLISRGCNGDDSCAFTGDENGYVQHIMDSCVGYKSCYNAAYYGGYISGGIKDSCNGNYNCFYAAACPDPNCGSYITEISSSCGGEKSCYYMAAYGGGVGGVGVNNGCNAYKACLRAGYGENYTISSGINDCCNMASECVNITEATLPEQCNSTAPNTTTTTTTSTATSPETTTTTTSEATTTSTTPSKPNMCEDAVVCVDGETANGDSCVDACEGECCVGDYACTKFTGSVCKDGVSCFGEFSCYNAGIDLIVRSCNGTDACNYAGYEGGNIPFVMDSCLGRKSCYNAAYAGGSISGGIKGSCTGNYACYYAAACDYYDRNCGSYINEINSSCNEEKSCYYMAYDGGGVAGVTNSCNAEEACLRAGYGENNIISSGINDCCNTESECVDITEETLPEDCGATNTTSSPTKSPTVSPTAGAFLEPSTSPTRAPTASPADDQVEWYMNWNILRCKQDCDGPSPCGGEASSLMPLFDDVEDCCANSFASSPNLIVQCVGFSSARL